MDETYRMLGREHELELERDAQKWRRAEEARRGRRLTMNEATARGLPKKTIRLSVGRALSVVRHGPAPRAS
jgi:hypothetical protein